MSVIKKKIPPEYFELIKSGQKRFEIRVADFRLHKGDTLVLEEYDPESKKYTGRIIQKKVSYLLKFSLNKFGQKQLVEKYGLYGIGLDDF